ncbi:MAG TPA: LysR family transcriptional regulator substrate-binding protein, partial [Chthoniobacterales bacterium]
FSRVDEMAAQIRGATKERLRLAASGQLLRNHFPAILAAHRRDYPSLRLSLRETNQGEAERLLQTNEIDLAITEIEGKSPPGLKRRVLAELPLAFLVRENSSWKKAEQLLKSAVEREPFIGLPGDETLTRLFEKGFQRRKLDLTIGVEVASLESLTAYVAGGFGIGLGVCIPDLASAPEVRVLPIKGFPPLVVGALWVGKLPAVAQSFLEKVERYAATIR